MNERRLIHEKKIKIQCSDSAANLDICSRLQVNKNIHESVIPYHDAQDMVCYVSVMFNVHNWSLLPFESGLLT